MSESQVTVEVINANIQALLNGELPCQKRIPTPRFQKVIARHWRLVMTEPENGWSSYTFCCDIHKDLARSIRRQATSFVAEQYKLATIEGYVIPENKGASLSDKQFWTYTQISRKQLGHETVVIEHPITTVVEEPEPQEYVPSDKVREFQCKHWDTITEPGKYTEAELSDMTVTQLKELLTKARVPFEAKAKKAELLVLATPKWAVLTKSVRCENKFSANPAEFVAYEGLCSEHRS